MALNFRTVDSVIVSFLLDTNTAQLQRLIDQAEIQPLVSAYILEHFGVKRLSQLDAQEMRDLLDLIKAFRDLARGAKS